MAIKITDALANALLDQLETTIGTSPKLQIWSGSVPADESASTAGNTKLVEMTLPSDWMAAASGGSKGKAGTWSGTAIASGTATFFRICNSGGTSQLQGSVAEVSGGDLNLDNTDIAVNQVVNVSSCTITGPNL